jgi:hypothetical protein
MIHEDRFVSQATDITEYSGGVFTLKQGQDVYDTPQSMDGIRII